MIQTNIRISFLLIERSRDSFPIDSSLLSGSPAALLIFPWLQAVFFLCVCSLIPVPVGFWVEERLLSVCSWRFLFFLSTSRSRRKIEFLFWIPCSFCSSRENSVRYECPIVCSLHQKMQIIKISRVWRRTGPAVFPGERREGRVKRRCCLFRREEK